MLLSCTIELSPSDSAFCYNALGVRVHRDRLHQREVYHHAALNRGPTCRVMAATTNCNFKVVLARECNASCDVGLAATPRYHCRMLVN